MRLVKLCRDAKELSNVLDTSISLNGMFCFKRTNETRTINDCLNNLVKLAVNMTTMLNSRRKLYQCISYLCGKKTLLHHTCFTCREKRQAVIQCVCLNLLNAGCTNTTTRCINNAHRSHIIIRVYDNLKVCHNKESSTTDNLIRNTGSQQHILENTRLCVSTIEHGNVVV